MLNNGGFTETMSRRYTFTTRFLIPERFDDNRQTRVPVIRRRSIIEILGRGDEKVVDSCYALETRNINANDFSPRGLVHYEAWT